MSRPDRIHVRDLRVPTFIGVNPGERERQQDVVINLALFVDVRRAGESDSIADAVNYDTLVRRAVAFVQASQYGLLEALASQLARLILAEFPVERVRVRVDKPGALESARSAGVELERSRADFGRGRAWRA